MEDFTWSLELTCLKKGGGGNISSFLQLKTPKENGDEPVTADLKTLDHGISA